MFNQSEYHKKWINRPGNKEKRKIQNRTWRLKNRERLNSYLVDYLKRTGKNYYKKRTGLSLVEIHRRITKKLGTPKLCDICKTDKASKYEWSNKDHKYSENTGDWKRLCTSCHKNYDRRYNGIKVYSEK